MSETSDQNAAASQEAPGEGMPAAEAAGVIQSHAEEADVTCPVCGHTDQAAMWTVLEAACNPERADQLATGALLVHTCSACGALLPLDYPLLYVDREHKAAVFYPAGEGDFDAIAAAFAQAATRFRGVDLPALRRDGFALRVVAERHQLVEKVLAWRSGLSDELLEALKVQLLHELRAQNPGLPFQDVQLVGVVGIPGASEAGAGTSGAGASGGKLEFALFEQGGAAATGAQDAPASASIAVPFEAYVRLAGSAALRQQVEAHPSAVVDAAWAEGLL